MRAGQGHGLGASSGYGKLYSMCFDGCIQVRATGHCHSGNSDRRCSRHLIHWFLRDERQHDVNMTIELETVIF